MSEWKVQDYILLILRIKEAELAELKCKMIFRLLRITEIPPLNHETVIVCIKAEDIIFCFYLISYFRFMIQRRNLLIDTGEDKKSYYI